MKTTNLIKEGFCKGDRGPLIDTHCHLEMSEFDNDRDSVIERAKASNIEAIITIGSDPESNESAIRLGKRYDSVYCSVGIHPHSAISFTDDIYEKLKGWASNRKVVAIGETGLDYHYMNSPREIQKNVFRRHIGLAKEMNLPLIVHSRDAKSDTLNILKEGGIIKGVLHCFSGDIEMAEAVMSLGFYISIAGPVTFKNAKRLKEIARLIPDDYLLLETDSPYLSPEQVRGKRNEPSYIVYIVSEIARLRGVKEEDIARLTTLNAKRLFGIGVLPEEGQIAYKIRDSLYLNITNRCTNECSFCIRFHSDYVKGHKLRLKSEPTPEELKTAIKKPEDYKEVVFCGYGEPLLRLDVVREVSQWVRQRGGMVRINTNGHGNLIHERNILPELRGIVDTISVSLNAHDEKTYQRLCKPSFKGAFNGIIEFIKEAVRYIPQVEVTFIEMKGVDIAKCKGIAERLGVGLRIRKLHVVG